MLAIVIVCFSSPPSIKTFEFINTYIFDKFSLTNKRCESVSSKKLNSQAKMWHAVNKKWWKMTLPLFQNRRLENLRLTVRTLNCPCWSTVAFKRTSVYIVAHFIGGARADNTWWWCGINVANISTPVLFTITIITEDQVSKKNDWKRSKGSNKSLDWSIRGPLKIVINYREKSEKFTSRVLFLVFIGRVIFNFQKKYF